MKRKRMVFDIYGLAQFTACCFDSIPPCLRGLEALRLAAAAWCLGVVCFLGKLIHQSPRSFLEQAILTLFSNDVHGHCRLTSPLFSLSLVFWSVKIRAVAFRSCLAQISPSASVFCVRLRHTTKMLWRASRTPFPAFLT